MRRIATTLIALGLFAALGPITPAAPAVPVTPAAPAGPVDPFPALTRALAHVPLSPSTPTCSVGISRPDGSTEAMACQHEPSTDENGAEAFTLSARSSLQTPGWHAALAPLRGGADGAFVRVHGYGDVAAAAGDGRPLWTRGSMSFYEDWQLSPWIVPFVLLGASPLDPRALVSERPFAVTDVTGDGADDVVVAHYVRQRGEDLTTSATSVVTVLDGDTGDTLWFRRYPGFVTQLVASGGAVIVGQETGNVASRPPGYDPNGQDGSTSSLRGLRFAEEHGDLIASEAWTLQTGKQWARWLAAEPIPGGLLAASWMDKPFGAATGTPGHTLLVDAATGEVRWQRDNAGYPRALRHDPARNAIVVAEASDQNVSAAAAPLVDFDYRYSLVSLGIADGQPGATVTRDDAVLLSLAVADVAGSEASEWVVGDLAISPHPNGTTPPTLGLPDFVVGGRVSAIAPETAAALWTRETRCPHDLGAVQVCGDTPIPLTYGLHVAGEPPVVVAASVVGAQSRLRGLSGSSGAVLWDRAGDPAFPLFLAPAGTAAEAAVLAATPNMVVRAYDVTTGETELSSPVPYELYAADAVDLDRDGIKEVIAGGASGAVFALDVSGAEAEILWGTEVDGVIHKIEVADLGSDGRREIVVAASSSLAVLDLSGRPIHSHAVAYSDPYDYVWTFTTGDVNGDGRTDVAVPGRTLAAYDGRSGEQLWEFAGTNPAVLAYFSEAVITPDRRVASQFLTRSGIPFLNARSHQVAVAIDGPTGQVAWANPVPSKFGIVNLWRSVVIDPDHSCGQGSTIGFTWDDSPGPLPGWYARTDFYDSLSGLKCFQAGPQPEGIVHMGTTHIPGTGLLEFNWFNVAHLRPDGVTETHFAEINAAVADVAMADFGPLGKRFLKSWVGIQAFAPSSPTGADGDNPPELARWGELETGTMLAEDLDGDGADEVVALPFDWPGYATVAGFQGAGVFSSSFYPHGIAVLEAG